ncbi:hypothetical protein Tco_0453407, partial [Tanacetum coccineum]
MLPITTAYSKIRVKEQETWSPKFIEVKDEDLKSGDKSDGEERENDNGNLVNDSQSNNENELDDNENDIDHVSESSCMNVNDHEYNNASKCTEHPINFDDPFKIYKILDKNNEKGELE